MKRNIPLPSRVLAVASTLSQRLAGPQPVAFRDDLFACWDFQCAVALADLETVKHSASDTAQLLSPPTANILKDEAAPSTPVQKTRLQNDSTPVSMYLGYFLETGPPSPMCVDDSPHTKRYKSWFSKQLEHEAHVQDGGGEPTLVDSAASSSSSSAQPRQSETGHKGQFLTHAQEDGDEVELVGHGPSGSSSSTLDPRFYQTSQSLDLDTPVWDDDDDDDDDEVLTRSSDLYNSGVASWSQEDPAVQSDVSADSVSDFDMVAVENPAAQASSVLSDDAVKGPLRFRRGKKTIKLQVRIL